MLEPMARTNSTSIGPWRPVEEILGDWRSASREPLYLRLAGAFRQAIAASELLPGGKLPPERQLAARLGVGRNTVAAAYEHLRDVGLLDRRQGSGTIVRSSQAALGGHAAELSTALRQNVVFRTLSESSDGALDLFSAHAPSHPVIDSAVIEAIASAPHPDVVRHHGYYPLGLPSLRAAVAEHLTRLGAATKVDQVLITTGAQQAISLVATVFADRGQVVVEDPTFPGAIDAFRIAGARILTVPVGDDGADLDRLGSLLESNAVGLVYIMPSFHNPTGTVMPSGSRRRLAHLVRSSGALLVEDNTLAELAIEDDPPAPMSTFGPDGTVLSIGSLSKLFWGGLRIGWVRAPAPIIAHLGRVKAATDLGSSIPSQVAAAQLLTRASEIHELRRHAGAASLAALGGLLGRYLPDWTMRHPKGGLCVWVRLPYGSSVELAQVARRHRLTIVPGSVMSARMGFDDHIRLPLGRDAETMEVGVTRLARAWEAYSKSTVSAGQRMRVVV